jgi:hypothetical protein
MARDVTRPRRAGTVRMRITLVAALTVAVVLAVAAVGLVMLQRRVEDDGDEPALRVPGGDDAAAQVVTLDDEVLPATPNIAGRPPIAPAPGAESTTRIRSSGDDEPYRLLSVRATRSDRDVVVHVDTPSPPSPPLPARSAPPWRSPCRR